MKIDIRFFLLIALFFIIISFLLGIFLPIISIEKFYLFSNKFSILESLLILLNNYSVQNITLFLIIVLFTVVFPIIKFFTMYIQVIHLGYSWSNKFLIFLEKAGHFSMLDVFVISLMVVILKLSGIVQVYIHIGFYFFSLAVISSIVLSSTLKKLR